MTAQPTQGVVPEWTLGDRLRRALRYSGVDVGEMAEHFEVSRNTISNYINDHTTPNKAVLLEWSRHTGVRVEWLQTGVEPGPPGPRGGGEPDPDALTELTERKRRRTGHADGDGGLPALYLPHVA